MITAAYVRTMAAYNRWQNEGVYRAAAALSAVERTADRGAFFGSIEATLTHLLWADRIWMSRFAGTEKPAQASIKDSVREVEGWEALVAARGAMDDAIEAWATRVTDEGLAGALTWYSGVLKRDASKPLALLVAHFFNHQTHHRGQVHAMLTEAGASPGDTDLFLMPGS